ncbi:aKG-HExxH-type peptide beta-hydroxylase [Streptomyces sp. NPDC049879]|uniref:aKG-HExxH-type peptide beta-hydroxylase n=1 Tax=Streptomyces sp. NPDC049879 TaxID=3365598 RepID=UPI00378BC226
MKTPPTTLTDHDIAALGATEGSDSTLALLTAGQHTRRLLLLRVLLDAVDTADATPGPAAALARHHADLLENAERAAPDAARRVLFYSLTGPWAERCVKWLQPGAATAPGDGESAARDIAHLGSLAASAAAHADLSFTTGLTVHDGRVTLPTLGALRCPAPDGTAVTLTAGTGHLLLRAPGGSTAEILRDPTGAWYSDDPRWLVPHTLHGGPRPVLLDDLDPGRLANRSGPLAPAERAHWAALWHDALPLLGHGGDARAAELALLDCIVPLSGPPTGVGVNVGASHSSGTSPSAFGAVLASTPPTAADLAAGLAHELQHAKLCALTDLVRLHTAGDAPDYWAPWRPDPRPFNGFLHGVYAHLALAGFWQRLALALDDPAARDHAWAAHARCHAQVDAVLPVLRGSRRLTDAGRVFVDAIAARHEELRDPAPPHGHRIRATAYVETARTLWLRQHPRRTVT